MLVQNEIRKVAGRVLNPLKETQFLGIEGQTPKKTTWQSARTPPPGHGEPGLCVLEPASLRMKFDDPTCVVWKK